MSYTVIQHLYITAAGSNEGLGLVAVFFLQKFPLIASEVQCGTEIYKCRVVNIFCTT